MDKKELKRKTIAKSCCELFAQDGFTNISVETIAKTAGIGKGTIYEYFTKKEDIILELMGCLQEEYDNSFKERFATIQSNKEKLFLVFEIFLGTNEKITLQRAIYKQFLIVSFIYPSNTILEYHANLRNKYISVIENISNDFDGALIFDTIIGFFVVSITTQNYNLQTTITQYLDHIGGSY
jgi:TetR/AcrR family acrAB operon transcriptional repressor